MNNKFKLLWLTDTHFDHAHQKVIEKLCRDIVSESPDAIVITGDISNAKNIVNHLGFLELNIKAICPIFFVLGNHDYWFGSVEYIREVMTKLFTYSDEHKENLVPKLGWLGSSGVIPLTQDTFIVGHDGWYDGQYANWYKSNVWLWDYTYILELGDSVCPIKSLKFDKINELAQQSADYIKENIELGFAKYNHAFVATHVPPFDVNSVYEGKKSDNDWMPHFSSKRMGDMLLDMANKYPEKQITVLCGHSHGFVDNQILPNLRCITGKAKYKYPGICDVFEL